MLPQVQGEDSQRTSAWPGRAALVLETPSLHSGILEALQEINAPCAFRASASAPRLDIASIVQRERPDVLFVEVACIDGPGAEWIETIRGGSNSPLIVAVHPDSDPKTMIEALRAGASEFLSLPLRPAIFETMDRLATLLESRQAHSLERGKMIGILSAKGGCGATTIACHLGVALRAAGGAEKTRGAGKILIADLDSQSPSAHRSFRVKPRSYLGNALESVRRLNSGCWPDFVTSVAPGVDLLAGLHGQSAGVLTAEPWRIDGLFRFLPRNYSCVLADLGRHINTVNWSFLPNLDELIVITSPDVLALYQTRALLQTLSVRGFDKVRLKLILNKHQAGAQDFWVESIQKMFEMQVLSVIPEDNATLSRMSGDHFDFPANSAFGRAVTKLAGKLMKPGGPETGLKSSARRAA